MEADQTLAFFDDIFEMIPQHYRQDHEMRHTEVAEEEPKKKVHHRNK